jgi:hypothetical protein
MVSIKKFRSAAKFLRQNGGGDYQLPNSSSPQFVFTVSVQIETNQFGIYSLDKIAAAYFSAAYHNREIDGAYSEKGTRNIRKR